jgi:phosphatidylinositol-3-phosphatase
MRIGTVAPGLIAALTLLAACTGGSSSSGAPPQAAPPSTSAAPDPASPAGTSPAPAPGGPSALPVPDHVMVVIFENEDAGDVLGSGKAPYLDSLAGAGATFTDAHGLTHPSQPNYLGLFSGSMHGVDDNSCPHTIDAPNLGSQLLAAGRSFVGYAEGLPSPGSPECSTGDYARKHNPWVNFADLPASVNQPYSALPRDFADLPTVSFVVPDLCNDMHDCGIGAGDRWAAQQLAPYVDWSATHNSLLVVTFDEDGGSKENHIATFLVGPMVQPGPSDQRIDHYSLLRTLEDMYGLPPLGSAAAAQPITGIWRQAAG